MDSAYFFFNVTPTISEETLYTWAILRPVGLLGAKNVCKLERHWHKLFTPSMEVKCDDMGWFVVE